MGSPGTSELQNILSRIKQDKNSGDPVKVKEHVDLFQKKVSIMKQVGIENYSKLDKEERNLHKQLRQLDIELCTIEKKLQNVSSSKPYLCKHKSKRSIKEEETPVEVPITFTLVRNQNEKLLPAKKIAPKFPVSQDTKSTLLMAACRKQSQLQPMIVPNKLQVTKNTQNAYRFGSPLMALHAENVSTQFVACDVNCLPSKSKPSWRHSVQ